MAKNRQNNRRGSKSWQPDYSTEGVMDFSVNGYVQSISEGDNVDYVHFYIDNPYVKNNTNSIDVEVPWDGFPQLEVGDHVNIMGNIRSWWNAEIKRVTYSFVCEQLEVIKDDQPEPKKKSRRGIVDPLQED